MLRYASCRTETMQLVLKCLLLCSLACSLYPQILEFLLTTGGVNVGSFGPPIPCWLSAAWESEITATHCRHLCRPTLGGGRKGWSPSVADNTTITGRRTMMTGLSEARLGSCYSSLPLAWLPPLCHSGSSWLSRVSPTVGQTETGRVW